MHSPSGAFHRCLLNSHSSSFLFPYSLLVWEHLLLPLANPQQSTCPTPSLLGLPKGTFSHLLPPTHFPYKQAQVIPKLRKGNLPPLSYHHHLCSSSYQQTISKEQWICGLYCLTTCSPNLMAPEETSSQVIGSRLTTHPAPFPHPPQQVTGCSLCFLRHSPPGPPAYACPLPTRPLAPPLLCGLFLLCSLIASLFPKSGRGPLLYPLNSPLGHLMLWPQLST